jgi:hypothetical protein
MWGLFYLHGYLSIKINMGRTKKDTPKPKNKINLKKNFKRIQENNRVLKALLENQG